MQSEGHCVYTTRYINSYSINEFKSDLSYETWDCVFGLNNNPDVNTLFNSFLNNYLRIFYNHFYQCKITRRHKHTPWITPGIRTSCKHKRFLYLCTKSSNDISLKKYYKQYCKILANVIKEANIMIIIIKLIYQQIKSKQLGILSKRKLTDIKD